MIVIPEGVIRALYLAVHRRSRTIQHGQMPRSFAACIACRSPKIRYNLGIHLCFGKIVPVLIIKQLIRRFTRHEQIKIIDPLGGFSTWMVMLGFGPMSARAGTGSRTASSASTQKTDVRFRFITIPSLPLYANRNMPRKQTQVTNTIRYDFSSVLLDKSCVCGYNSKVILRKCHEKEEYFFFVCSEKVRVGASTSARGKKVALEQGS